MIMIEVQRIVRLCARQTVVALWARLDRRAQPCCVAHPTCGAQYWLRQPVIGAEETYGARQAVALAIARLKSARIAASEVDRVRRSTRCSIRAQRDAKMGTVTPNWARWYVLILHSAVCEVEAVVRHLHSYRRCTFNRANRTGWCDDD